MRYKGFTLIELIISTLIFAVVIVTVYGTFNMGLKAWRRGSGERPIQRIRITLLKMEKELKNSFLFSKAPFKGASNEIIFPAAMPDGNVEKICVVSYVVEKTDASDLKKLIRKEEIFSEGIDSLEEPKGKTVSLVKEMRFEYSSGARRPDGGLEWQDSWNADEKKSFPAIIRISFGLSETEESYNKIIFFKDDRLALE